MPTPTPLDKYTTEHLHRCRNIPQVLLCEFLASFVAAGRSRPHNMRAIPRTPPGLIAVNRRFMNLSLKLLNCNGATVVPPVYNIVPQYGTKIPAGPPATTCHRPTQAGEAGSFQTGSSLFDPPGTPYARHLSLTDPFNFVVALARRRINALQDSVYTILLGLLPASKLYYIYIGVSDQSLNLNSRKATHGGTAVRSRVVLTVKSCEGMLPS